MKKDTITKGVKLIAQERQEQIKKHGFDLEIDAEYYNEGELRAAALYAITLKEKFYPGNWETWFLKKMKAKKKRLSKIDFDIERLKIAGALIAAEIDRLLLIKEDNS